MRPSVNALAGNRAGVDFLRLESLIRSRSYGQVRELRLEWQGASLVLRGRASSFYLKQLAQQAVIEAGCLAFLANEIEVARRERNSLVQAPASP